MDGNLRLRLIDVRSGREYIVQNIDQLSELVLVLMEGREVGDQESGDQVIRN